MLAFFFAIEMGMYKIDSDRYIVYTKTGVGYLRTNKDKYEDAIARMGQT